MQQPLSDAALDELDAFDFDLSDLSDEVPRIVSVHEFLQKIEGFHVAFGLRSSRTLSWTGQQKQASLSRASK